MIGVLIFLAYLARTNADGKEMLRCNATRKLPECGTMNSHLRRIDDASQQRRVNIMKNGNKSHSKSA